CSLLIDIVRAERRDQTLFLRARFRRERIKNESSRTDNEFGKFKLLRLAREFLIRIACPTQSWFPVGIPLGFFTQQTPAGLPISNREIVDSLESSIARGRETFQSSIFIRVNRIVLVDFTQPSGDFSIKLAQNRVRAEPAGFMF